MGKGRTNSFSYLGPRQRINPNIQLHNIHRSQDMAFNAIEALQIEFMDSHVQQKYHTTSLSLTQRKMHFYKYIGDRYLSSLREIASKQTNS